MLLNVFHLHEQSETGVDELMDLRMQIPFTCHLYHVGMKGDEFYSKRQKTYRNSDYSSSPH